MCPLEKYKTKERKQMGRSFSERGRNTVHDELGLTVSVALETVIHNGENLGI